MSSSAQPVSTGRFAEALQELPLSTLHSTAAEIRNSRNHLESSNQELQPLADEGDQVCKEAIDENAQVLTRMQARLNLLKAEVERRGMPWVDEEPLQDEVDAVNGNHSAPSTASINGATAPSGSLSDEELRRRLEERMAAAGVREESEEDAEDGVHL